MYSALDWSISGSYPVFWFQIEAPSSLTWLPLLLRDIPANSSLVWTKALLLGTAMKGTSKNTYLFHGAESLLKS